MKTPWLPTTQTIPQGLVTARLQIRPLTIHDVAQDHEAVMSSRAELRGVFPGSDWPRDDLSLEQDLIDLAWHQKEFEIGGSHTYTVLALDGSQVLGCVYLFPPTQPHRVADLIYWVRSSKRSTGLHGHLRDTLRGWLVAEWGFSVQAVEAMLVQGY